MAGIGKRLRIIRKQWHLSLREVEERSLRFAMESGNPSYHVSASWLNRLERDEHEFTVNKLIVLAHIYGAAPERLLRSIKTGNSEPIPRQRLSNPNETMLLMEGSLQDQAKCLLPDTVGADHPPDQTTLLPAENGALHSAFRWGVIGRRDGTLDPMLPAGSTVQIDSRKRAISSQKEWMNEFQRPVYFLMTGDAYVCGWCELDNDSEWLTLIPHPLSLASSRRWKYRKEVETIGRVISVAIPFGP